MPYVRVAGDRLWAHSHGAGEDVLLIAGLALLSYAAAQRPRRIVAPTLLTVGSEDQVLPPAHTHAVADLIPDAAVTVFEGCGQQLFQERRERFNAVVRAFLVAAREQARPLTA